MGIQPLLFLFVSTGQVTLLTVSIDQQAVSTDAAEEVVPVAKGYTNQTGPTGLALNVSRKQKNVREGTLVHKVMSNNVSALTL